jgi:hypothetical protein
MSCSGGGGGNSNNTTISPVDTNPIKVDESTPLSTTEIMEVNNFVDKFEKSKTITKEELFFLIQHLTAKQKKSLYVMLDQKLNIDCDEICTIQKKENSSEQ